VLEDLGLIPALAAMANELIAQTSLEVRRRFQKQLPPLAPEAELVIFRVTQEALTNVTRHARAGSVDICLEATSEVVTLRVADNGRGLPEGVSGAGIRGMRERALLVGGQLHVGLCDEGGAEVVLHIPRSRAVR
jgi:two-component system sensor histidine kinase UhpB